MSHGQLWRTGLTVHLRGRRAILRPRRVAPWAIGGVRRLPCLLLALLILLIPGTSGANEYVVKAAFLERFTRFIDWPAGEAPDSTENFVLGVIGESPFGETLDELTGLTQIKGRPLEIRYYDSADDLDGCHLLFVARSEATALPAIVKKSREEKILTVGDGDGFAERGAILNFIRSGEYVRFEVNREAAESAGFRISSRLLKLAVLVEGAE